ncbi:MAG: co-chaperone HscB [Flavisolibacter sp.]
MNYFELFEIPISFKVNKDTIQKKYFELSRKYHPDYFINGTAAQQNEALQASAMLNKAYKVFSREDDTIKYTLILKGLLVEEEKYVLKPSFLMEMMEINEQWAEAKGSADEVHQKELRSLLEKTETQIRNPVQNILAGYVDGETSQEELLKVKDYYFKKKYLERLSRQMDGKL